MVSELNQTAFTVEWDAPNPEESDYVMFEAVALVQVDVSNT